MKKKITVPTTNETESITNTPQTGEKKNMKNQFKIKIKNDNEPEDNIPDIEINNEKKK